MKMMDRARELAGQTPPHRNRYVDYLRALSIGVVVYGHWLMAIITMQDGRVVARHMLAEAPVTQAFTWIFQVMPVFFMVGGYSNAASWAATERSSKSYADWLRSRCQRLLGPTVVFALVWIPIAICAQFMVPDQEVLVLMGKLVAIPLWFMAVYLAVIPLAPAMLLLHRRLGLAIPLALTFIAAGVDILDPTLHVKGQPLEASWGWINFAVVWLAIHQLGFFWQEGRLERHPVTRWALLGLGLGGLVLLTASGAYSFSMIGVPGSMKSNNTPPTVVLIFLATFQMGLILVTSGWANRRLAKIDPWARTILANSMIMTMYLWHITAMLTVTGIAYALGYRFPLEPLSGLWWLSRAGWLLLLTIFLFGFVALFNRFERPRPAPSARPDWKTSALTCAGALLAGVGLAGLAIKGMCAPGEPWGLPIGSFLLLLGGAAAVGVTPALYRRRIAIS